MADDSPRPPDRKLGLIAPLTIALVVVALLVAVTATRGRRQESVAPLPEPVAPPVAAPAPVEVPTKPMTRADLLGAANALAAAYSAGAPAEVARKDPLVGRAFALRIPFGCDGPQVLPGAIQAYYTFDAEKRTVRLVARQADWTSLPVMQNLPADQMPEAVEGFWVPRPWSASETCPVRQEAPLPATPAPPTGQTLGLARLFPKDDTRVGRRNGRPFEQVIKLGEDEELPLGQGYRLVLEGRLASFPDGRAGRCWSESADHRPICIFATQIDRVAFVAGDDGRLLAEWRE